MYRVIESLKEALFCLKQDFINAGYRIVKEEPWQLVEDYNKYVHSVLTLEKDLVIERVYIVFKSEPFYTFGRKFPNTLEGFGESLNVEAYQRVLRIQPRLGIIFVHPDAIYHCDWKDFSDYTHSHSTIRRQDFSGEVTVSIPLSLLRRVDLQQKKMEEYTPKTLKQHLHHTKRIIESNLG